MPKIEVHYQSLQDRIGQKLSLDQLEALFPAAKAELDEKPDAQGFMKVELNDTNRPDLWSTEGLARLLRIYQGGKASSYGFFSQKNKTQDSAAHVVTVDSTVSAVRPYIAAFVADGKTVDDASLRSLIQSQEKLCWNFGQKRKSIAMGIYRADQIQFPVTYRAESPTGTSFVPLGMSQKLSLAEILKQHPKGQEFGHILQKAERYPLLVDKKGAVLSMPPIINSADLGAVEVGDSRLFVELTGTDLPSLLLACNIMACDMSDAGFAIHPVKIDYPKATVYGSQLTTPYYFQEAVKVELAQVQSLLGEQLPADAIVKALKRMDNQVELEGSTIKVQPSVYRNDFLHSVDIIEDVMIGRGMDSFVPELPRAFTVGRLSPIEVVSRKVKSLMVGLGYQEMIFNYLGSARDFIWKMKPDYLERLAKLKEGESLSQVYGNDGLIQIMNPMSENFEFVRGSVLPSLLGSEAASANAPYPHQVFEIGKTACIDTSQNSGTRTDTTLCCLVAQNNADFNLIHSQLGALFFYIDRDFVLKPSTDLRFIPGRCAAIEVKDQEVGIFGEVHPGVLQNWGITVPCAVLELRLDFLLER